MRLPTYDKPRIIGCAEEYSQHIGFREVAWRRCVKF